MTQQMQPTGVGDPGAVARLDIDLPGGIAAHRLVERGAGKQPTGRSLLAPVCAQLLQQTRGEGHIAILTPLALLHADGHAGAVDIGDPQPRHLTGAQPRGIGGHQQRPMFAVGGDREQAHDLLMTEDLGQLRGLLGAGQIELGGGPVQGDSVEKPQAMANGVAARPGQMPLLAEVEQVVLDLLHTELIGAAVVILGQAGDRLQVGFLGVLGQIAHHQVVEHFASQRCHGAVLRWVDQGYLTSA
jgi:hypothetical protein